MSDYIKADGRNGFTYHSSGQDSITYAPIKLDSFKFQVGSKLLSLDGLMDLVLSLDDQSRVNLQRDLQAVIDKYRGAGE